MIVASPEYQEVTESWFSPECWGTCASEVTAGGRGGAWFIEAEPFDMVLRHYRRGGLMARLSKRSYWFTGFHSTRSIEEFRLMRRLRNIGLPVPDVVAAIAWRHRLFWYRAAILVKRIPGAVTFPDCQHIHEATLWEGLGVIIRRFHDAGLNHVDLNCDNILVTGDQIYLIDFDRCRLLDDSDDATGSKWRQRNLERLRRSVHKRCIHLTESQRERLWRDLILAYNRSY